MATTINSYNVKLGLDASDYISKSSLSRQETAALRREINGARTPTDNYERSIRLLDKALQQGAIDQGIYNRLVDQAGHKLEAASKRTTTLATSVTRLGAGFLGFQAVKSLIGGSIDLAAQAEQSSVSFNVLLKDAKEAEKLLGDLRQFAASTPFEFPEIRDAGRMLLAFGFTASEVKGQLGVLGNIASGTGTNFGELAELIGKARVQNTIYSEDLNQLTGRGINVLDGLADRFGVTTDQVKKLASESKITFGDLNAVLKDLANTDFAGLMVEQSKTLNGQWSNLKGIVSEIRQEFGEGLLPAIKESVSQTTVWARNLQVGLDAIAASKGFLDPASGDGLSGQAQRNIAERQAAIERDKAFLAKQLELREKGLPTVRTSQLPAAVGEGLNLGIDKGMERLRNGAGGLMHLIATVQDASAMVAMAGTANTQELIKATKEDPAIKSLEVGTQEAYSYLIQSQKEATAASKEDTARKKQLEENADRWRQKTTQWQDHVLAVLEKNGFKRIR